MSEPSDVDGMTAAAVVPVDGLAGPAGTSGHPQGGSEAVAATAVMLVGDWNTTCSACGHNVDPRETHHGRVLLGYPNRYREDQIPVGCGALFVGMRPAVTARIMPGVKPCGSVASSRPDLPVLS